MKIYLILPNLILCIILLFCCAKEEVTTKPESLLPPISDLTDKWVIHQVINGNCTDDVYPQVVVEFGAILQNENDLTILFEEKNDTAYGTISGDAVTWEGDITEDYGTTHIIFNGKVHSQNDSITGSAEWTWTDDNGDESCSGTTIVKGKRLTYTSVDISGAWQGVWSQTDSYQNQLKLIIEQDNCEISGLILFNKHFFKVDSNFTGYIVDHMIYIHTNDNAVSIEGSIENNLSEINGTFKIKYFGTQTFSVEKVDWFYTINVLDEGIYWHTDFYNEDALFIVGGGSGGAALKSVYMGNIKSDGTIDQWYIVSALTPGRMNHAGAFHNGYVYILGGWNPDLDDFSDVRYTFVDEHGKFNNWQKTQDLPYTLTEHSSEAYNGYIYVIGGNKGDADLNSVLFSKINNDGTLSEWDTTSSFSKARLSHATALYNGFLYLSGGTSNGIRQNDVQYAKINSDGSVGVWKNTTSLPISVEEHAMAVYKGYIYSTGGKDNKGIYQNKVYYAPIEADGSIGNWIETQSFGDPRERHTCKIINGYIYVIGGFVNGLHNVEYTCINDDGTLGY